MSVHSSSTTTSSSTASHESKSAVDTLDTEEDRSIPKFSRIIITTPNFSKKIEKPFDFNLNETVWKAKQDVLLDFAQLPELKDALNFGFYMPPYGGRAGKFLDEERYLSEYITNRVQPHLEFRYKRRIFRHLQLTNEKMLQKINTKKHRKKFIEIIHQNNTDEACSMLEKGLDPNYHDEKSGDTPLIIASLQDKCENMLKLLVQFGAYLDFRSEAGSTALHCVAINGNVQTLKILLDLGGSPNYKDSKGLTPLYYSITKSSNPLVTELLLNDHAQIGIKDINGLEEIHQVCKLGHIQNLEHLIYYGADVNSRTASGSTPLHICALENRENCARVLLFRGANKHILNFAGQSPYDVAVVSNNFEVATLINEFSDNDVKKFADKPIYSNRRRTKSTVEKRSSSENTSSSEPSSPKPVLHHSISDGDVSMLGAELSKKSSTHSLPNMLDEISESGSDSDDDEKKVRRRKFVDAGIGTKRSPAPMKHNPSGPANLRNRLYSSVPGRQFVAICNYEPQQAGELALEKGEIVEVLYVGEQGFWEGRVRGRAGWFPSYCVQETKKGKPPKVKPKSWFGKKNSPLDVINNAIKAEPPKERMIVLKRGPDGYGFILKGANSHMPRIDFVPTPQYPALQYIGEVEKGSVAEKAGLKPGDFVLEINEEDVVTATHSFTVSVISKGKDELRLKVITVAPESVSPELIQANGTLRSKDVKEVKGALKESGLLDKQQTGKPKPPPPTRSTSTQLTPVRREGEIFSEGSIDMQAETVVLDTNKNRKESVKGMWSGSAFKLNSGEDVSIREDNIASGMSRKQKGVSVDLAKEFDEKFRQITKPCVVDPSNYPPPTAMTKPPREDPSKLKKVQSHTEPPRKQNPPDYEYTLESLRRGRANSIGKGDPRPASMYVTSSNGNERRSSSTMSHYVQQNSRNNFSDDVFAQKRLDNYLEEQQFATIRRQNVSSGSLPIDQRHDPRLNGRPMSALMERDLRGMKQATMDPRMGMIDARFSQIDPRQFPNDPYNTLPTRLDKKHSLPAKPETVLQAHQRHLYEQDDRTASQYQQSDGLVRLQNERSRSVHRLPSHSIAPVPSPTGAEKNMPAPPPPPPPPDYVDSVPTDALVNEKPANILNIQKKSSNNSLENSLANAVAGRSERMKLLEENNDKSKTDIKRVDSSDNSGLYNSSSSVSLDSTSSKDSGIDNSESGDHTSVLAQAIALRAAKISSKEHNGTVGNLPTTVEEPELVKTSPENTSFLKPSEIAQRNRANSRQKDLNITEEDKGYSSPSPLYRGRSTSNNGPTNVSKSNAPPPATKPKPKKTVSKDKNNNLPEDIATTYLDGVIADAEASIDYDLISVSSSSSLQETSRKTSEPTVAKEIMMNDLPLELPPPPDEFLDDDLKLSDDKQDTNIKTVEKKVGENADSAKEGLLDPPPPYTPYTSDSISTTDKQNTHLPTKLNGKPYTEWNVSDVCEWLEYLDLSQYKDTFTENDIEGKHLPELTKDEMKELGVKKLGHRMTLDDAISKLCRKT